MKQDRLRVWLGCALLVFAAAEVEAQGADRAAGLFRCQIHRGGGHAFPDNALESFLWAWGHGVAPEADARLTRDGVAIAFHDDNLARIPRGMPEAWKTRKIKDMTWDEVRGLDTGSYLGPQYASTRIVLMETVFAAMRGRSERLLYLDEKGAPPELMAELSERFGVQGQVYYCSSCYELLPRWKRIAPKGRSMLWMGSWSKSNTPEEVARTERLLGGKLADLEKRAFEGVDQVQIHVRTDFTQPDPFCPSSAFLKRAGEQIHRHGRTFQVISWTEGNNPETYRKLWDLGVDSFATDYPRELIAVLPTLK